MPAPLGHATIGLATHALYCRDQSILGSWKTLVFVVFLSNLPDIDVLVGLVVKGNGNSFHRGFTHSLFFSFVMGLLCCNAWKLWPTIPKMDFLWCFLLMLSHVLADAVFTDAPVSLWWPLETTRIEEYCGWNDVFRAVFRGAYLDMAIIFGFGTLIVINRLFRYRILPFLHQLPVRITAKTGLER